VKSYRILESARARISDERDWSQGEMEDPSGAKCVVQALFAAGGGLTECDLLATACGGSPMKFNDSHSHAEVLGLLDSVIAEEKAREGLQTEVAA